jgi:hypothetical protein
MASLSGDTVTLTATGEKPTGASNLLQGNLPAFGGIAFGQGVRCVGGVLKRLYTHTASHGVVSAPLAGEPSVSARSAALGDPISAGSARYYLWYYRDPIVLGGCPASLSFNATPTGSRIWAP